VSLALYMDVHIPHAITNGLRKAGIDVLTAQEDSKDELDDKAMLFRASTLNRIVFTYDEDFLRESAALQESGQHFAGIIAIRSRRLSMQRCLTDLQLVCELCEPEELANLVYYLPL